MQDMILSEVLDSSSGVRWSDIAGLATAKQARAGPAVALRQFARSRMTTAWSFSPQLLLLVEN